MQAKKWRYGLAIGIFAALSAATYGGHRVADRIIRQDTTVVGLVNLHEMPGNTYLSRSMRYFLKIGNDSSRFHCLLYESKENKKLGMDLRLAHETMTWSQQLRELEAMMPVITKEFFLDSLGSISLGRLCHTGDADADVTRLYRDKVTKSRKIPSYRLISQFLLHTALTSRLNELLLPYGLKVKAYSLEKVFFIPKNSVISDTRFETAVTDIPDFLLDAMVWVTIQRK